MKRRWLRVLLLGSALLALLLGACGWLLMRGIDGNAVLARVEREVMAATGRTFAVDGPLRLKLLPRIALEATGVRLGNAPWGSQPDMARIGSLRMDVALMPLLQRNVEIGRIELSDADLLLETDAQGLGNWNFASAQSTGDDRALARPGERTAGAIRLGLAELTIRDSRIRLRNGRSAQAGPGTVIDIETLALSQTEASRRWQVTTKGKWREQAVEATGQVGMERDAVTQARSIPIDLALVLDGANIDVEGALDLGDRAGQGRLKIDADLRRTNALEAILGMRLAVPMPAQLNAEVDWQGHHLVAKPFELTSQGQTVAGQVEWNRNNKPATLQLNLHADGLDLARLYPSARTNPVVRQPVDGRLLSDAPLPRLHIPALAIQADLRAERLVLPNGLELISVHASGSSLADRIDVDQLAFGLARGNFKLSGRWQQPAGSVAVAPQATMNLQARGVAMDALLAVLRREAPISGGRTDIDARLTGTGHSLRSLAASLNGEVRLKMGSASTAGTTLAHGPGDLVAALLHLLTPLRDSSERVQIRCAAARLPVRQGQIVVDRSIAVESERVDVVMSGVIDLGTEQLELAMRPTVRKGTGLDPSALAGVAKIGGTFAAPKVQVNLAGTAREALSIGAAVATSGLSLLGERLLGRATDPNPCETAYEGGAGAANARPPSKAENPDGPLRRLFGH
ncbi:AsmA family protein [Variovorax dokdonensis]|uniref:AsmA family protein n=1 Tax=Variovorax dokdonensis TaxID=344883 RepID=A0ABT7NGH1_9BURK|nr:AsmA family protein [Variovorax dokdonensis]MDM0047055.1 AsmA family protein [Variovorax dokdonensis]